MVADAMRRGFGVGCSDEEAPLASHFFSDIREY